MKAPRLNRKLVLMAPVQAADGAGGYTETWTVLGTLWASVKAGIGREAQKAGLSISSVPYKIVVRAAAQGADQRPVAGQRFVDGARIFRILAVSEADENARFLTCFAREEVVT